MLVPLLLSQLLAAPPAKLDLVPEAQRAPLVALLASKQLVGKVEVVSAGDTDDGASVLLREVAGEGDSCRERLYKASGELAGPLSWQELGSDCCSLTLLRCDRSDLDWMYHTHRVLEANDPAAMKALVGGGVVINHAAAVEGKLETSKRKYSAKQLNAGKPGQASPRFLIAFGYLNMTVACGNTEATKEFDCTADAGGIHLRFTFQRQRDPKRPKAPWSTLEARLVRADVGED